MSIVAQYYPHLLQNPSYPDAWSRDIVILSRNSSICEIISYAEYKKQYSSLPLEIYEGSYIPALINAHTHLDINYMHKKTVRGEGFLVWLISLLAIRIEQKECIYNIEEALNMMPEVGYILSLSSTDLLSTALQNASISHTICYETISSFFPEYICNATDIHAITSLAGHSLYSTMPDVLQYVKRETQKAQTLFTIHLAEHQEECDFLNGLKSEFSSLLRERLLPKDYLPPKVSPVEYANNLGLLDSSTLAVHCVHLSHSDIRILAEHGVFVCICPRSNAYIGVGKAPVTKMLNAGIPVCLGTDSLASNDDISLWNEARYLCTEFGISVEQCIQMMTTIPAKALKIDRYFGMLYKGYYSKAVKLPQDIDIA